MKLLMGIMVTMLVLVPTVCGTSITGGKGVEIENGFVGGSSTVSPDGMVSELSIADQTFIKNLNDIESFSDGLGNTAISRLHVKNAWVEDKNFYQFNSGIEGTGVFAELKQTGDITEADYIECSATAIDTSGIKISFGLIAEGNAALSDYYNKAYAGPDLTYIGQSMFLNADHKEVLETEPFLASGDILKWYLDGGHPQEKYGLTWTPYDPSPSYKGGVLFLGENPGGLSVGWWADVGTTPGVIREYYQPADGPKVFFAPVDWP